MGNESSSSAAARRARSSDEPGPSRNGTSLPRVDGAVGSQTGRVASMRVTPGANSPGAYSVPGPGRRGGDDSVPYTVVVPQGVRPGQQFQVMAGGVPMMVTCPSNVRAGEQIMVMVPRQQPASSQGIGRNSQVYTATVPQGARPGGQFNVTINGRSATVSCPENVRPGMQIRIRLPAESSGSAGAPGGARAGNGVSGSDGNRPSSTLHQTFEVTVPNGVRPGQPFALIANGQRVIVHCPAEASPGQQIRFQLPIQLSETQLQSYNIHYDKDGWVRCVGTDLKFHWVKHASDAEVSQLSLPCQGGEPLAATDAPLPKRLSRQGSTFNIQGSAFVRKLTGSGPGQQLVLVRAEDATLDASVPEASLTFQHLSKVSTLPFPRKMAWFHQQCDVLRIPWDVEHQHIKVRRSALLEDSMRALMTIKAEQMRQRFRYEFIGEPGVDAGGVAREWFHLTSEQLFNPNFALFQYSAINQMCMQLNPASGVANDEHVEYFKFAGRLLGKALFDNQLVQAHLVRPLYKHLLAWPLAFSDLEHLDNFTHDSLLKMTELEDVSICSLDFTVTEDRLGCNEVVVELLPGGADMDVVNENLDQYMELILKHRLLGRVSTQLKAFLNGFYDVIPEALLSVFDFQELELLMCGLPTLDLDDWKQHTDYTGEFARKGAAHKVVKWFWEVLEEFDDEQKARLLQFVTGTSGVPSQGFSVLQGNDGNIRKFTVNGASLDGGLFPRAHTCFNRIDLPVYAKREDTKQYLSLAIQLECTGFDIAGSAWHEVILIS
ncbi:unnamed protein product [Chrysoparadoxa australica]